MRRLAAGQALEENGPVRVRRLPPVPGAAHRRGRSTPSRPNLYGDKKIPKPHTHPLAHPPQSDLPYASWQGIIGRMALVKASDYLSAGEIRSLRRRSDLMGAALLLHCWGAIAAAGALYGLWPNAVTLMAAVLLIGGRQLGLAVLMHEAAHGTLFKSRAVNDAAGRWLCAFPIGADLDAYRRGHMAHHRYTQEVRDPDLGLSAPFPISKSSLARKIARDLSGWTFLRSRAAQIADALGPRERPFGARLTRAGSVLGPMVTVQAMLLAVAAAFGQAELYLLLWLLPLATVFQLVLRVRNIAEHAVVPDSADPLRNTRTTYATLAERMALAPYWVNYHLEHHLFPWMPAWRLPGVHRLLKARGLGEGMELQPSYAAVLKRASARREPARD